MLLDSFLGVARDASDTSPTSPLTIARRPRKPTKASDKGKKKDKSLDHADADDKKKKKSKAQPVPAPSDTSSQFYAAYEPIVHAPGPKGSNYYDELLESSFLDPTDEVFEGNEKWEWVYDDKDKEEEASVGDNDSESVVTYMDDDATSGTGTSLTRVAGEFEDAPTTGDLEVSSSWDDRFLVDDDGDRRTKKPKQLLKNRLDRAQGKPMHTGPQLMYEDDSWIQ